MTMKNVYNPMVSLPIDERRKFIRHQLCFPLNYQVLDEGAADKSGEKTAKISGAKKYKSGRSTSINISIGGILFAAKHPVKVGAIIVIKMPFQDKIFNVKAKVAHCIKNSETKLYNIGATFHSAGSAYKVKLVEQLCLISEFRDIRSIELGKQVSLESASKEWIKRYSDRFSRLYW